MAKCNRCFSQTCDEVGWRRGISPPRSTDPCVNLSIHTAPHIQLMAYTPATLLYPQVPPFLVDLIIKLDAPTPSLHLHSRDFNATTSWSATVFRISVLSRSWDRHLRFSLNIRTTASHVPHKSQNRGHPSLCRTPPRRYTGPLGLSCKSPSTHSFDAIRDIPTPHQWFACAHLLDSYLTR